MKFYSGKNESCSASKHKRKKKKGEVEEEGGGTTTLINRVEEIYTHKHTTTVAQTVTAGDGSA